MYNYYYYYIDVLYCYYIDAHSLNQGNLCESNMIHVYMYMCVSIHVAFHKWL